MFGFWRPKTDDLILLELRALRLLLDNPNPQATRSYMEKRILMAIGAETQAVITALKEGTDLVAARIDRLVLGQKDSLSDEAKTEFAAISANLRAMGTDPNNPVPRPS